MSRKCALYLLVVLYANNYAFSQSKIKINPVISLGLSIRDQVIGLTDYDFTPRPNRKLGDYDAYKHTGPKSVVAEARQNILTRNLFAQVSGYFRYGHVFYDSNKNEIERVKVDAFLDLLYRFTRKKNENKINRPHFLVGLGIGRMNINTRYQYKKIVGYDINYYPIYENRTGNFSFFAPKLLVGMEYKRFNAFAIANITPDDDEYVPDPSLLLEFKITYGLTPKKTISNTFFSPSKITIMPRIFAGFSVRPPLIELSGNYAQQTSSKTVKYNPAKQARSINLIAEARQNILRQNLFLQLSGALRYGHVLYDSNNIEIKRIKADVFLDFLYAFKKKKYTGVSRPHLLAGIGFGRMNMNTQYPYRALVDYGPGVPYYENRRGGFRYAAPRLLLGMEYKTMNAFIIAHGTPDKKYLPNPSLWMELKLTHSFNPTKKKL